MATLQQRIQDLATRIATECKSIRTLVNGNAVDLSALNTTSKTNLVSAINELKTAIDDIDTGGGGGGVEIDDNETSSTTKTWSITKISAEISTAFDALVAGAPAALDTLYELAAALNNDAGFESTVTIALGNRVRIDTASQGLNSTQQQNARTNIDAYGSVEIGDPDTNFVSTFNTGLV